MTNLRPVTEELRKAMAGFLPSTAFPELTQRHLEEPRGLFHAGEAMLVEPASTREVARVVEFCNEHCLPVVPCGGGTGLVGGQVPTCIPRAVLLSLRQMDTIHEVSRSDDSIIVEAGCTLQAVKDHAARAGRLFPLTIAAQGTSQIGGNLATNAGGVNVIRYGNARDLCLGLEAVLPNGDILHGLSRLRKDNVGYDLRDLLIGSEGTLGVITAASLKLFRPVVEEATAFLAVASPKAACDLLEYFRNRFGHLLSAFELIHRCAFEFVEETIPGVKTPFRPAPAWSVLVEVGSEFSCGLPKLFEVAAADALDRGLAVDGILAASVAHRQEFWRFREALPEANRRMGALSSHDISVPLSAIPEFIDRTSASLTRIGQFRINCFGHVGDGNLHFNVFAENRSGGTRNPELARQVREVVYRTVASLDGSFSAEHGVGRLKLAEMQEYCSGPFLDVMHRLKTALDPKGIMNPGAVLPSRQGECH